MRALLFHPRVPSLVALRRRAFSGFATPEYHGAFSPSIAVDSDALRAAAVSALARKDASTWHTSPVVSLLGGEALQGGTRVDTVDAFGAVNGAQLLASEEESDLLLAHAASFRPQRADLREAARRAEERMLTVHAGDLIANQTLDFGKQDGVTEIEEALQANAVERRLNDQLWEAEEAGELTIPRRVALVPCVSNFSHFLDMCRKGLRLIELGVPIMVLSRTHTQQYPYRWVSLLADELAANGIDPRYLSFCSADLSTQQRVMRASDRAEKAAALTSAASSTASSARPQRATDGLAFTPCLFTGDRTLARSIKAASSPGLIASTQGPNLMVALGLPAAVASAAALSATIEHAGQCTALRVLVAPAEEASERAVEQMFDQTPTGGAASAFLAEGTFAGHPKAIPNPNPSPSPSSSPTPTLALALTLTLTPTYLVEGTLAGLLDPAPRASPLDASASGVPYSAPPGYTAHPTRPIAYRHIAELPHASHTGSAHAAEGFEEFWRQVVVDVVTPEQPLTSDATLQAIGEWLVTHQPISLAVNGTSGDDEHAAATEALRSDQRPPLLEHLAVARALFERSALCVYSVGDASRPALTAQARPQDGEIFGELPPLSQMSEVTTYPVLGPTPSAGYFASYEPDYLCSLAADASAATDSTAAPHVPASVGGLLGAASSPECAGYMVAIGRYLEAAATGPRRCVGARTGLYGLQRPPLDGKLTVLRCSEATTLDELLPFLVPFVMTNAAEQAMISVDPANDELLDELPRLQLTTARLDEIPLFMHTEDDLAAPAVQQTVLRTIRPDVLSRAHRFPLAPHFVTRLMPAGHIKSSRSDDQPFVAALEASPKWLRLVRP